MKDVQGIPDDDLPMTPTLEAMAERLLASASRERRTLVAIAGPPAAGKSTLTERLCERVNALHEARDPQTSSAFAVVVPMDGYHYDNAVLAPQGRLDIKGAPETFDVAGLQALFDLSVFIDVPDSVLVERLLCRWRDMGQDPIGARARTHDKDMLNARLVNDHSAAPDWRWQFHAAIRHSLGPKESSHD